jgi:hypothetical protein
LRGRASAAAGDLLADLLDGKGHGRTCLRE